MDSPDAKDVAQNAKGHRVMEALVRKRVERKTGIYCNSIFTDIIARFYDSLQPKQ